MKCIKITTRTYYKKYRVTFNADANLQSFVVPDGVNSLEVDCVGSSGYPITAPGGDGGRVQCNLPVTPGTTLYVMVGVVPTNASEAQYNASDIRTNGAGVLDSASLSSRIIVAGGGGSSGSSASNTAGAGGGLIGGDGTGGSYNGKGGTQSAGGAAGDNSVYAHAGSFGLGGTNTRDNNTLGAGGAGWYGGGSAGGTIGYCGGGGSSYTDASCFNVVHTQGYQVGVGYVTLTYTLQSTESDYDFYIDSHIVKVFNLKTGDKNNYYAPSSFKRGEIFGRGSYGYTVVGSPNIVDGVASGFSSSDYLQLQKNLPVLTTTNNWEMGSKIITPASGDGIILGITTWYLNGFRYVNNGKKVVAQFYDYANGAYVEVSSGTLSPNTAYYIKTYCSGTNLVLAVSTDKQTWTEYTTALSSNFTTNPTDYHVHLIGGGGNYGTFGGSIDLKETYIFCDGFCFFRGDMPNGRFI